MDVNMAQRDYRQFLISVDIFKIPWDGVNYQY